jgi:hypothetical protein
MGTAVAEELDEGTALETLEFYEGVVRESRELCGKALSAAIACDREITRTVAARLQEYRDERHHQNKELVARAAAVERSVTAWMPPLLAAQGLLVAVSLGKIESQSNTTIEAFAAYQRHVVKAMPETLTVISIHKRLAQAKTFQERVEVLSTLSDDERQALERGREALASERQQLKLLVARATLIQSEIAGTVAAILDYLVARRLFLDRFIEATKYFDDVAEEERTAFEATVTSAVEALKVAIDFLLTKAGPKLLEQVPIVGLALGAATLVNEMRVKRREFCERSVQIQERTEALIGRNASSEMLDLENDLTEDAEKLVALSNMVGMLEEFLRQSAS